MLNKSDIDIQGQLVYNPNVTELTM